MEQILKNKFPDFKVNDSSDRNFWELQKITELCHKVDKLLVFVKRNSKNDYYFKLTEKMQNFENINIIFLNKDDIYYYYIEDQDNIDNIVLMSLKRKLLKEIDCVICLEECLNNYMSCIKCGNSVHSYCLKKCVEQICSICRYNHFLIYQ